MDISFIVPAYNEEAYLAGCLASLVKELARSGRGISHEIIVVNNASTDRTAEIARAYPGVRVVDEPEKGLTRARQRGFEASTGDIVAYIDADTRVTEGWLKKVFKEFTRDPSVVAVSGPNIYYGFDFPWQIMQWPVQIIWPLLSFLILGYYMGGNFAARRYALLAIGGFDTSISFYGEDAETARRLNKLGSVAFIPSMVVKTSARRFKAEGPLTTLATYTANHLAVAVTKKPVTREYKDIR